MNLRLKLSMMFVVAILLSSSEQIQAQVAKLYPVDEAARDPSFFVFRARLIEATQQRDWAFVLNCLSPDIQSSFGGDGGTKEFQQHWKPERPDSQLWNTLNTILSLGGSFQDNKTFAAPYTYSKFPDQLDAFELGVIVGENVRVRQSGSPDGPVIATLSFDIVKVPDWTAKQAAGNKQAWVPVKLANGLQGYVAGVYLRSPIDYRAIFEKKDGKWILTALVAGD